MKFKDTSYGDLTDKVFIGNINISGMGLTSLDGAPKLIANGSFDCSYNHIETLEYSPSVVNGSFNCSGNKLSSLISSPLKVTENYSCFDNLLTSLSGSPIEIGGGFFCGKNNLTSFENAPKKVGGNFNASDNQLTRVKYAPKEIGGKFYCSHNPNIHLELEYKTKQENPELSDKDFYRKMYEKTKDTDYLPEEVKDTFIF